MWRPAEPDSGNSEAEGTCRAWARCEHVPPGLARGARSVGTRGRAGLASHRGKRPRTAFLCVCASARPSCGQFEKRHLVTEPFRGASLAFERPRNSARSGEKGVTTIGTYVVRCADMCLRFSEPPNNSTIYNLKKIKTPLNRDYLTGRAHGTHASTRLGPLAGGLLLPPVWLAGELIFVILIYEDKMTSGGGTLL